jgi:hypothetical protein
MTGVRFAAGTRNFSLLHNGHTGSEANLASTQWIAEALLSGIKWPGSQVDHSNPTSTEVKNGGVTRPLPIRLHDVVLSTGTTLI